MSDYFSVLFDPEDHVNICRDTPRETRTENVVRALKVGKWVCANPLNQGSTRRNTNIAKYRNFVLEMDEEGLTPEDQIKIVEDLGIKYSTAVFSGNKSVHFVISLVYPVSRAEYLHTCKRLKKLGVFDKACLEPTRLTRMPTTSGQDLLRINKRVTFEELQSVLPEVPIDSSPNGDGIFDLTKTTLLTKKFLSGMIDRIEAHNASLHAAVNLLEVGCTTENLKDLLTSARQLYLPKEDVEKTSQEIERLIDWAVQTYDDRRHSGKSNSGR